MLQGTNDNFYGPDGCILLFHLDLFQVSALVILLFLDFNCDPAKLKTATKPLLAVKKCCSNCMLIYLIPRDTQAFHEVT